MIRLRDRFTKPLPLAALTLAAFPLLLLVAFLGYVVEARLHLGHWPSYGNPDPKDLGWWMQHTTLQLGFLIYPIEGMFALALAIIGRVSSREFPIWTVVATGVFGNIALFAFGRIDPGGFVDWFWD